MDFLFFFFLAGNFLIQRVIIEKLDPSSHYVLFKGLKVFGVCVPLILFCSKHYFVCIDLSLELKLI